MGICRESVWVDWGVPMSYNKTHCLSPLASSRRPDCQHSILISPIRITGLRPPPCSRWSPTIPCKTLDPTVKLSRASTPQALDSWHRRVLFRASIVDTPSAKAISQSLANTPAINLVSAVPTFTKLDLDEDGDPVFQRQSADTGSRGYQNLSLEGLFAYKKAVEDHKTRADKVVALNAEFMKTHVYGTVHDDLLIELGSLPDWSTIKTDPAAVVHALRKLLDTNKYDTLSAMVSSLMSLKETPPSPGENSARTFVNAVRQAARAIVNALGTKDIAVDVLGATVLVNGVSSERSAFVSSLRATNALESMGFEELGTKLIEEGARTLPPRDVDGSKALSASALPPSKEPTDGGDKQASACPLCSLISARVPGLVVARANHSLASCWMVRETERYFRSDRPHRSDKQRQQQQQLHPRDTSATAARRSAPMQLQQQAYDRRVAVADAAIAPDFLKPSMPALSRSEYVQRRLAAEADFDAMSAAATALSATGPHARPGDADPDVAAHRRLDSALERYAEDPSFDGDQWRALFARVGSGHAALHVRVLATRRACCFRCHRNPCAALPMGFRLHVQHH